MQYVFGLGKVNSSVFSSSRLLPFFCDLLPFQWKADILAEEWKRRKKKSFWKRRKEIKFQFTQWIQLTHCNKLIFSAWLKIYGRRLIFFWRLTFAECVDKVVISGKSRYNWNAISFWVLSFGQIFFITSTFVWDCLSKKNVDWKNWDKSTLPCI